ncbi:MAG: hypothetical protein AB2L18_08075 [Anaerolineaceae bacterium]
MINNSIDTISDPNSFLIYEAKGFKKRIPWKVNLSETQAEFICQEGERTVVVPRSTGRSQIKFIQTGFMFSEGTVATISNMVTLDFGAHRAKLAKWFPPLTGEEMQKDLRNMGIGMIVIGVLSLLLRNLLDPVWGMVIIVLGVLNLVIKHRAMYIVNGIVLVGVGIFNILAIVLSATPFWVLFGIMQIGWGISEIKKYNQAKA